MVGGAVPEVVPDTFVLAENGDVVKARARYERTMQWRKDLEVDDILRVCSHLFPHTTGQKLSTVTDWETKSRLLLLKQLDRSEIIQEKCPVCTGS